MTSDDYTIEGPSWTERLRPIIEEEIKGDGAIVCLRFLRRVRDGETIYGALHLDDDTRNFLLEKLDEDLDGDYYAECDAERKERRAKRATWDGVER